MDRVPRTQESNIYDLIHEDMRVNEYMKYPLSARWNEKSVNRSTIMRHRSTK